jgi:hypothetical protein
LFVCGADRKADKDTLFIYQFNAEGIVIEKLIVAQLVKKFPVFYGTRRFITVFT